MSEVKHPERNVETPEQNQTAQGLDGQAEKRANLSTNLDNPQTDTSQRDTAPKGSGRPESNQVEPKETSIGDKKLKKEPTKEERQAQCSEDLDTLAPEQKESGEKPKANSGEPNHIELNAELGTEGDGCGGDEGSEKVEKSCAGSTENRDENDSTDVGESEQGNEGEVAAAEANEETAIQTENRPQSTDIDNADENVVDPAEAESENHVENGTEQKNKQAAAESTTEVATEGDPSHVDENDKGKPQTEASNENVDAPADTRDTVEKQPKVIEGKAETPDSQDAYSTAMSNMADYMREHNYGPENYEEYSKDPEWYKLNSEIQKAKGEEVTPPTPEVAMSNMADYLREHNYGPENYEEYSKDPEWYKLNSQLERSLGMEITPPTLEVAHSNMADYLREHNYSQSDRAEYTQDPEWQKLNAQLEQALGKEVTTGASATKLSEYYDALHDSDATAPSIDNIRNYAKDISGIVYSVFPEPGKTYLGREILPQADSLMKAHINSHGLDKYISMEKLNVKLGDNTNLLTTAEMKKAYGSGWVDGIRGFNDAGISCVDISFGTKKVCATAIHEHFHYLSANDTTGPDGKTTTRRGISINGANDGLNEALTQKYTLDVMHDASPRYDDPHVAYAEVAKCVNDLYSHAGNKDLFDQAYFHNNPEALRQHFDAQLGTGSFDKLSLWFDIAIDSTNFTEKERTTALSAIKDFVLRYAFSRSVVVN